MRSLVFEGDTWSSYENLFINSTQIAFMCWQLAVIMIKSND
jgi:hypothetical protein